MYLFVYGILKGQGELVHKRYKVNGSMYDLGSYPGITELGSNREAVGNIIRITQSELDQFDRIEGVNPLDPRAGLYRREIIPTPYGSCYIYLYNRDVTGCPPISEFTPYYQLPSKDGV